MKDKSLTYFLAGAVIVAAMGVIALFSGQLFAAVNTDVTTQPEKHFIRHTFFTATTTTATSTNAAIFGNKQLRIAGAKKVNFYLSRGDTTGQGNTGTSRFEIQVTPDGDNWYAFNKLIQNVGTSTADITVPSTISITAATSTVIVGLDLRYDSFYAARCVVNETTDGEHTCTATAEF
jgi:hypothetical protein